MAGLEALVQRRIFFAVASCGLLALSFGVAIGAQTGAPVSAADSALRATSPALSGTDDSQTFTATPGATDQSCNGGKGAQFPVQNSEDLDSLPLTALANGTILVSAFSVEAHDAVIRAFRSDCRPDSEFGRNGVSEIALPKIPKSRRVAISTLNAMGPSIDGGALLVGETWDGWLVGKLEPDGRLDPRFGRDGWAVLHWPGEAEAVLEEPSGRIVVGGGDNQEWVGALGPSGAIDHGFGHGGRVGIPTGHDSGIEQLALEPNGNVMAFSQFGNMGCWHDSVASISSLGTLVPGFANAFSASVQQELFPDGAATGDIVTLGAGFAILGTRQPTCVGNTVDPAVTGYVAEFQPNGDPNTGFATGGVVPFDAPMEESVWAFPRENNGFLVVGQGPGFESVTASSTTLDLWALTSEGTLDPAYGDDGRAQVQLPVPKIHGYGAIVPIAVAADHNTIVVVGSTVSPKTLQLLRIPS